MYCSGLDLYIENYKTKKNDNKYFSQFENGCDAMRDLVHNYGHLSVWDTETLKRQMLKQVFHLLKFVSLVLVKIMI